MTTDKKTVIDKNTLAQKTEILLEYPQIMQNVASHSVSEEASAVIRDSHPVYDESALEIKEIICALYSLLKSNIEEPRSWLPSIGFLLPKIKTQGTVLDIDEVLAVGLFIERSVELKQWLIKGNSDQKAALFKTHNNIPEPFNDRDFINSVCFNLPDCASAAGEIFKIIDREGNLRDLPVLRAIRKRISGIEKDLKNVISRYSADDDYKRMLQSPLPSQRDGRAVIAVKANFRGRIRGIVHEVSSSGQTVFVEPLDVVEKNNELLIEKRNLDAEIQKLLRELTEKIAEKAEELSQLHIIIIKLECFRAKAKYSVITKGQFADNREHVADNSEWRENLVLLKARHPMLKKAVPVNISMSGGIRTLIITGPNTGGKTVALKTLGLLAMMNQSGLALPVDEGSVLPIFDGIYADIGDEQSINQSLSTFSAHITKISSITEAAGEKSLVLLDELGSGTDPQEGGAIAMVVLDYLIEKKSRKKQKN